MTTARQPNARLVLIVGPSGAGKDTLIDAARVAFAGLRPLQFPKRYITRPQDAGGEEHIAVDAAAFSKLKADGAFCLDWVAHGLSYGVPETAASGVRAGRSAVVNVSRAILPAAEALGVPLGVIHVTATPDVLALRLAGRGRETAADIKERLAREVPLRTSAKLITVLNDGTLAEARVRFIAAIEALSGVNHSAAR